MQIDGAIFDMDGTLVDSLGFWTDVWAHFGERYLNNAAYWPSDELSRALRTTTVPQAAALIHSACGFGESAEAFQQEFVDYFLFLYRTKCTLKADVIPFLDALQARGIRMCVASASDPVLIDAAIDACGIRGYFSGIVSCSSVGKGKDCPDVFFAARDFLGTPMETTWVFEDSALALETAHRAGFRTVGVYDSHTAEQDRIMAASTEYIAAGQTFLRLL